MSALHLLLGRPWRTLAAALLLSLGQVGLTAAEDAGATPPDANVPQELHRWLAPQLWERDTAGPVLPLGEKGTFDDTHIFAPCVARLGEDYFLWYSGSTGAVAERVFQLGLAHSDDGKTFIKHLANPVYQFGDGRRSILTPTLLRRPDGSLLKENGVLRMWFSSTDFTDETGRHALHEATSADGIHWSRP